MEKSVWHRITHGQFEGKWVVFNRLVGAFVRSILVVALIVMPSLLLPNVSADAAQVVALVAMFGAALTFFEYMSAFPGLIEFRDAPPFNRVRFLSLFVTIFLLTLICRGISDPSVLSDFVTAVGALIGYVLDLPYSPVRLMVQALPDESAMQQVNLMRVLAGLSYLSSLISFAVFLGMLHRRSWPSKSGSFNVWINLPTFDPTVGGDVVSRLKRDARVNIILGFALPFIIPAVLQSASSLFGAISVGNYQSMIWTVAAWAFLPSSLFMRGVAMHRVAIMIDDQRRQTYAAADLEPLLA
ncbi:hypothetical protein EDD53_2715 [Pacificibacter maritimus]|uniref:Uncharacterized protein n=1 Tax=Pacificibacter maritimus TaxID=762213 RepID=A0A3N4TZ85_9RHOB|nr:hypothetical protein EDD53_2715 [Pacificibacter maritimus]